MRHYVILGAGATGRATARALTGLGHRATIVSRRGTDPVIPGVTATAADVCDHAALQEICAGAVSIINALNPSYTSWQRDWPPMAAAILRATERAGASLITISNLYGYGPVDEPMTEQLPLAARGVKGRVRAQMWHDACAAHTAGRVRVTELRASDYFGADAGKGTSLLNQFVIDRAARGRSGWLVTGRADVVHSWTYLPDIGRHAAALATASTDSPVWGRAWHTPTNPARSPQEVADDVTSLMGRSAVRVRPVPAAVRRLLHVVPLIRELDETAYQFDRPFVVDSTETVHRLGLEPTPWHDALAVTAHALAS